MAKRIERIENIEMTDGILAHVRMFGSHTLVQKVRDGKFVVGTDIVARLIPTAFKTRREAEAAAQSLVAGDWFAARRFA